MSTLLTMLYAVFKILRLGPEQIEVELNLRDLHHKQLNLNFSNNDVQWNPKDGWCRPAGRVLKAVVLCCVCLTQSRSWPVLPPMAPSSSGISPREPSPRYVSNGCSDVIVVYGVCVFVRHKNGISSVVGSLFVMLKDHTHGFHNLSATFFMF